MPEHIRAITSPRVIAVEQDLTRRLATRGQDGQPDRYALIERRLMEGLDRDQRRVLASLVTCRSLLVVEGAAGAGKTTTLAAARATLEAQGRRMVVATPTRKAAQVAANEIGAGAHSVAWLLHQWGFRWDQDGHWGRVAADPSPEATLAPGDLLVVDEAGMLDQDTARALLSLVDGLQVRLALVGDRHQLPAVGRGGVLDLAVRYAPDSCIDVESVHRFADHAYADLSLRMRRGESPGEVFDELVTRGEVVVHPSEAERLYTLAAAGSRADPPLVVADTREQVAAINALVHDVRLSTREVSPRGVVTAAGAEIGVGDRIATRRNDPTLDVANREVWTVTGQGADGSLTVRGRAGSRHLPADYVDTSVELAYATTAYGAQGETVSTAHVLIGDHTGAASAYVGMTRGRDHNVAHLVAESLEDGRRQWIEVFGRDRADLGPAHAARQAAQDLERYGPSVPRPRPALASPGVDAARRRHQEDVTHHRTDRSQGYGIGI